MCCRVIARGAREIFHAVAHSVPTLRGLSSLQTTNNVLGF
jgi:hypothetical protein